eukprot:4543941-Prymnesium_polylepis.1
MMSSEISTPCHSSRHADQDCHTTLSESFSFAYNLDPKSTGASSPSTAVNRYTNRRIRRRYTYT